MLGSVDLLSKSAKERCIINLKEFPALTSPDKPKETAAVLVPICIVNNEVSLLFTLRSTQLKRNGGQVSYPGGKSDEGEDYIATALRETEEELGISRQDIEVWASMPALRTVENDLLITPVVGFIRNFNFDKLKPNKSEVDQVFTVPVRVLCDPSNQGHLDYKKMPLPVFIIGNYKIWGLTGMMTYILLQCLVDELMENVDFLRKKYEVKDLLPSKL